MDVRRERKHIETFAKSEHKEKILLIKTKNPGNPHKLKSVEVFRIKEDARSMAADIEKDGYLLEADDPTVKYIHEQMVKLSGSLHNLIENKKAEGRKCVAG